MPETLQVEPTKEAEIKEAESKIVEEVKNKGLEHLDKKDQDEILALRDEAAQRRIKARDAVKELEDLKAEQQKAKEVKLAEDGRLQELNDIKETELVELRKLKDENDKNKEYFEVKLEESLSKLTPTQRELIENSNMVMSEKLKYAGQLVGEGLSLNDSPDSHRPGGSALDKSINIEEYLGKENRGKLIALRAIDPKKYELILELKNKQ